MQIHREISRFIQFVMSENRDVKNKIDWYDEIKTPLMTSLILCDTGKEALIDRTEQLHKLAVQKLDLYENDEDEPLLQEEVFMKKVVDSR